MKSRIAWFVVVLPLLTVCASLLYQNWKLGQQVRRLSQPTQLSFDWPMEYEAADDYSVEKAMKIGEIEMQRRFPR